MSRIIYAFMLFCSAALAYERVEPENPDLIFDPPIKKQYGSKQDYSLRANSFGSGALTTDVASNDSIRATLLLTDGRTVAAGSSNNGSDDDFTILRYLPDGGLDTTFYTDGSLIDPTGSKNDMIHSLLLQTDGNYVAVGRGSFYNYDFAVNRYRSDGSLDTSFGTDGKVNTEVWDNGDFARAGALQTDAKILAAGYTWLFGQYNFALVRYNTNGILDTTFHTDGTAYLMLTASDNGALAMEVQTNGAIVLVGPSFSSDWDFAAVRYASDGQLDTSFSTDGKNSTAVGASDDRVYSLKVSTSGTILLGGYANVSDLDYALVRYLSSGELDTAFNTSGKLSHSIFAGAGDDDVLNALIFQPNETIIAGGYSETGNNNDFSITRYLTDGSLDTSFDTDGKATRAVGTGEDTVNFVSLSSTGQIFLGGRSNNGSNTDFAIARYSTNGATSVAGSLDLSFGTEGTKVHSVGVNDSPYSVVVQTDGRLVAWGNALTFIAARYFDNGSFDTSFHTDGVNTYTLAGGHKGFTGILQTDGKLVGVGHDQTKNMNVLRLKTDGVLDTTFHTDGAAVTDINGDDYGRVGVLQTDGKIVVTGNEGNWDPIIARYETDGNLDTSFYTDGVFVNPAAGGTDYYGSFLILTDGRSVVGGLGGTNALIARHNTDGSLDTSFRTAGFDVYDFGMGTESASNLILDSDNERLVFTGAAGGVMGTIRIHADGSLDTSFHFDGKGATIGLGALGAGGMLLSSSLFLYVGQSLSDFALVRYRTNGYLDTTFDTDGRKNINIAGVDRGLNLAKLSDGRICAIGMVNEEVDFGIICFYQ